MDILLGFGEGSSPSLHGDTLMVTWDHQGDSFIVALDALTGETKWKRERNEGTSWATPLIVDRGSRVQVITSASERVRSYDLGTGETIWECGGQTRNVIPTPVTNGTHVFCMSGFRGNAVFAIPLDASGDITDSDKIAWHQGGPTPYVPSPLLYGEHLYFMKSNDPFLSCVKAEDGETLFHDRLTGLGTTYASPVGAAGRIYIVDLDGNCLVLKRGPKLEVLSTNELGEPVDSSFALAGKQIFVRGRQHLYCIEEA
jgi:outer membrane protein assembly factor BamB